ncbi:Predicted DNA-binding transcriptional regulator YafY, contains an HTH and WYL domains [Massilia sp. PDC64]|nr:WYL domain-containing protein [Massilia sp. PDC64]SDF62790.1 Predicted DNA-binding transcriptional regulator YafY, contains an HTH and WYL domains [Massilia sp. PDC64]
MDRDDDGTGGGKAHAEQTLRRRLALVALLPDGGRPGISASALTRRLNAAGYQCVARTVERDLAEIAEEGNAWRDAGIDIVHGPNPANVRGRLWSHRTAARPLMLRLPSSEDALLVNLLAQELHTLVPASALRALEAYEQSAARLSHWPGTDAYLRYRRKIRILPDGPTLAPPPIDEAHLREINEALLRDEQVDLRYAAASRAGEAMYRLHPIGMVKKGRFFWLVAAKEENGRVVDGPRTFRMDRVRQVARRVNEPVARGLPALQDVLAGGVLEFFPAGTVALVLRSTPGKPGNQLIANYIDTPLGADQCIVELPEGGHELRATVTYTRELVWMLQAQAHLLQVVAPPDLREELRRFAVRAAALYADATGTPAAGACPDPGMPPRAAQASPDRPAP